MAHQDRSPDGDRIERFAASRVRPDPLAPSDESNNVRAAMQSGSAAVTEDGAGVAAPGDATRIAAPGGPVETIDSPVERLPAPLQPRDPGRYQIIAEHGRVFWARDKEIGRDIAIRELLDHSRDHEIRFLREGKDKVPMRQCHEILRRCIGPLSAVTAVTAFLLMGGCSSRTAPTVPVVAIPASVDPVIPPVVKPPGYVEAHAKQAIVIDGINNTVLLGVRGANDADLVIPLYSLGETESLSIAIRLHGEPRRRRPSPYDLLDDVIEQLGGEIVKVQIDTLLDGFFHGSVHIRTKGGILTFESRASDAIALAIGNHVPIYVAQDVVNATAITFEEFRQDTGVDLRLAPRKPRR